MISMTGLAARPILPGKRPHFCRRAPAATGSVQALGMVGLFLLPKLCDGSALRRPFLIVLELACTRAFEGLVFLPTSAPSCLGRTIRGGRSPRDPESLWSGPHQTSGGRPAPRGAQDHPTLSAEATASSSLPGCCRLRLGPCPADPAASLWGLQVLRVLGGGG